MKAWKTVVFLLLVLLGIELFLKLRTPVSGPIGPVAKAPKVTPVPTTPVDLTAVYDHDSSFDSPGCWQAVPRGQQTLGNIPFQIGGLIQLWGEGPAAIGRNYRERVDGIPATGKFQALYVLHGTSFTADRGTPIADVVFRYADGSSATNAIRYWTDSRDWWEPRAEHEPLPTNSASQVVWRGDHPDLPDWVKSLRLFGTGIPNPKPETEVSGVDLISTKSRVTWVVVAVTTGPSGLMKSDSKLDQEQDLRVEEITMTLRALDKETGQPIENTLFTVTLLSGRRAKPYGTFTADKQGEAIVDLPPERIKLLSIETMAERYPPSEVTWNVEKGEKIPTNYVFKLSRETP
jgi:hypothetical protein